MARGSLILAALVAAVSSPAFAVYKCLDAGKTTYQNDPCPSGKATKIDTLAEPKPQTAASPAWLRPMTPVEQAAHDEKIRLGVKGILSGNMNSLDFQRAIMDVRIGMHDGEVMRIDPRFITWAKTKSLATPGRFTVWRTYQDGTTITLTNSVVTAIAH